MLSIHHHHHFI